MNALKLFFKNLSQGLNWYHLISLFLIFVFIFYFLFFSYPTYLALKIIYSVGRIFFISIVSLVFSLIIGIFLSNIYFFTSLKIIKKILDFIFLIPIFLYGILFVVLLNPIDTTKMIIIFSVLMSYLFFNEIIKKIEELNREKFITHLYSININYFRIFLKHILPIILLPLFILLVESIIFIVNFEFIISITNIVSLFNEEISIGTIAYNSIEAGNYYTIVIILMFFTVLMLELNYLTYNIKKVLK